MEQLAVLVIMHRAVSSVREQGSMEHGAWSSAEQNRAVCNGAFKQCAWSIMHRQLTGVHQAGSDWRLVQGHRGALSAVRMEQGTKRCAWVVE
jgi:hypothetical protein